WGFMHILIALITAIGTLLWAFVRLRELGIGFNPFHWHRRYQWRKRVGTKPLHQIQSPMEAAAVLLVGATKLEGEISREQKQALNAIFEKEFKLSPQQAADLFSASAFMLQGVLNVVDEVDNIFAPNLAKMTDLQKESILDLLEQVCKLDSG